MRKKEVQINICMSKLMKADIVKESERLDLSISQLIRHIFVQYMKRGESHEGQE